MYGCGDCGGFYVVTVCCKVWSLLLCLWGLVEGLPARWGGKVHVVCLCYIVLCVISRHGCFVCCVCVCVVLLLYCTFFFFKMAATTKSRILLLRLKCEKVGIFW